MEAGDDHLAAGGDTCSVPGECISGVCNDGICCSGACDGACTTCTSGTGACVAVTNADDPDTCVGAVTCNATGACKLRNGQPSSNPVTCGSGFVSDGVCCTTTCGGACDVCASALGAPADGTCAHAPTGDPGNPACGNGLACNGTSSLCTASCISDADCLPADFCAANGTCQLQKAQGGSCNVAANGDCKSSPCRECASGFCIDGACCNTACNALCQACSAALKQSGIADGACGPAKDHTNPHKDACAMDAPATCGADGMCDGKGGCRLYYPTGTSCGPDASCQDGAQTTATTCDGVGTCAPPSTSPCGAYGCGATACNTSCLGDSDCASGRCVQQQCIFSATCAVDGHTVVDLAGNPKDCAPYVCAGGSCVTMCGSVDDCVSPSICDVSGKCIAPPSNLADAGGCSIGRAGARDAEGVVGAALIAMGFAAAALRRRRSVR